MKRKKSRFGLNIGKNTYAILSSLNYSDIFCNLFSIDESMPTYKSIVVKVLNPKLLSLRLKTQKFRIYNIVGFY